MNHTDAHALFERLLRQIAPEVDVVDADHDAALQDSLGLDSMDFLNLVTALHETMGIEVPERDYPQLGTIDGFVGYIARNG